MTELINGPKYLFIKTEEREIHNYLSSCLSYLDFAEERPSWDLGSGTWSGLVKLYDEKTGQTWPGLLDIIERLLSIRGIEYKVLDNFPQNPQSISLHCALPESPWTQEQLQAVSTLLKFRRACWEGVPRIGKTAAMSKLISVYGKPTVWVSHNITLAEQCAAEIEKMLSVKVGRVYTGRHSIRDITVFVAQSAKNSLERGGKAADFLRSAPLILVDEVHRAVTSNHCAILRNCDNAERIYGFSGTINVSRNDNRSLALRALYGPIVHVTDAKKAQELGAHVPATCVYVVLPKRVYFKGIPSSEIRDEYIYKNRYINALVVNWASLLADQGKGCSIIVDKIEKHILTVERELRAKRSDFRVVTGRTPGPERQKIFAQFERGEINILLSTVLSEGVNLPRLFATFILSGGSAAARYIQRLYRVRTSDGRKAFGMIVDFVHNAWSGDNETSFLVASKKRIELAKLPGLSFCVMNYEEAIKAFGLEWAMRAEGLYPLSLESDGVAYGDSLRKYNLFEL